MIGTLCAALLSIGAGALTILHDHDQRELKARVSDLHRRIVDIQALTPARKHTDATIDAARDLWISGLPSAAIGQRLGLSAKVVQGIARRGSFPPRPSPIRRAA